MTYSRMLEKKAAEENEEFQENICSCNNEKCIGFKCEFFEESKVVSNGITTPYCKYKRDEI
jgi:hypothetical protein